MKINHTYKDALTDETVVHTVDDATSPNSGYTQAYMDGQGKSEESRAQQKFDNTWLEWQSSEKAA